MKTMMRAAVALTLRIGAAFASEGGPTGNPLLTEPPGVISTVTEMPSAHLGVSRVCPQSHAGRCSHLMRWLSVFRKVVLNQSSMS